MKYNPDIHHRRSVRLKDYDYSQEGAYFITVLTRNRECLFGRIKKGKMILNKYGMIAKDEWLKTQKMRRSIHLDEFVIMPNHMHGIIEITSRKGTMSRVLGMPLSHNILPILWNNLANQPQTPFRQSFAAINHLSPGK